MAEDRKAVEAAGLAGSVASAAGVAALGAFVSRRNIGWYRQLDKPGFTPPDAVFGPVWSLLYAGQAVAAWLVWRDDARRAEFDVPALGSYAVQLGLNAAWTLLFFGLRRPALALIDVCVLWLAIAVTTREFARRHRFAAVLLLPYLAWVTYAAALNASVWWRNR
jgi:tryptophan-rich sensory protein